jgi:hypothetical protein
LSRYFARRLAFAIFLVVAVSSASLLLAGAVPGDFASHALGIESHRERLEQLRERHGLNKPLAVQYREWVAHAVRFDFGNSLLYDRPVSDLIPERAMNTAILALTALALAELEPPTGRGQRITLDLPGGGRALLIDESYNANPASMRAALALLGQAWVSRNGRRIAVLGDMLELGPTAAELHRGLAEAILAQDIDLVFCAGPLMKALWDALPSERRGGYADSAAQLEPHVIATIADGDAVMVKGSLGSKMGPIVKALAHRYRRRTPEEASVQG